MGDVFPHFVAASAQAAPVFLNREATAQKACDFIKAAAQEGAELIVYARPDVVRLLFDASPKQSLISTSLSDGGEADER